MNISILKSVGLIYLLLAFCISIWASPGNIHNSALQVELSTNDLPISLHDHKIEGFLVDYTRAILQPLNDSCTYRVLNRPLAPSDLNEKSLFLINSSGCDIDTLSYSVPLLTLDYDVIARKGTIYKQPSDLLNKKIIVTANSGILPLLQTMGEGYTSNLIIVPHMEVGLKMLVGGEADYAIVNHLQAKSLLRKSGFSDLSLYESGFEPQTLHLASINPYLIADINSAVHHIDRNGQFSEMYLKWYGQTKNKYITYVWILVGIVGFMLLLIGLMLKIFKTIVAKAKKRITQSNELTRDQYQLMEMLKADADLKLYQYDIFNNLLYTFDDNELCQHPKSLHEIESLIYTDDKGKYDRCFDDLINGTVNQMVCKLRIFKKETGKYIHYEFTVTTQKDKDDVVCKLLIVARKITANSSAAASAAPLATSSVEADNGNAQNAPCEVEKEETAFHLKLAMQAAKLILWKYAIDVKKYHVLCEENRSFSLTVDEWLECIHPHDVALYQQYLDEVTTHTPADERKVIRIRFPESPHYVAYELYAVACAHPDQPVKYIQGTLNDISSFVEAQSKLNGRTEILKSIYTNMPVGLVFYDSQGEIQKINNYLLEAFGLLHIDNDDLCHYNLLNDPAVSNSVKQRLLKGEVIKHQLTFEQFPQPVKNQINNKGENNIAADSIFDLTIYAVFDDQQQSIGYVMILVDKTNWYNSLSKIDELQNNLGWTLDIGGLKAWIYDHQIESLRRIKTENTEEEILSKTEFIKNTHPDDVDNLWNAITDIYNRVYTSATIQYRYKKEGKWHWFQSSLMAPANNETNYYILGTYKDITDEIEADRYLEQKHQEIRNSEERLSLILNKLPIPVYAVEPETDEIKYINDAAIKLFGENKYDHVADFLHEDDIALHNKINQEVVKSNREYIANETLRLNDGTEFYTHVRKLLFEYNGVKQSLVIRLDQTKQREAEVINKIISTSLPSLKAYTWYIDMRTMLINYTSSQTICGHELYSFNTLDKLVSVVHPDDWECSRNKVLEFMKQEAGETTVHFRMNLDGAYEWWENRLMLETLHDENNEPYQLLYGIIINIDKQKHNELTLEKGKIELANLNKQNELILNNTSSGLVYLNTDYEVQWSNIGLIFGESKNHIYKNGERCYLSFQRDCVCEHCPVSQCIEQKKICQYDFKLDDNIYGTTAIPVFNGDVIEGIVLRIDDITERVDLINDLKKAKNKAEESDKLKMAFLANMSHEIRTPLNAIVGFSEMVQYASTPAERDEYISIINTNNELLLRLIGDVLDLSKIESGSIDIYCEETDVIALFNDIFTSLRSRCTNPLIEMNFQYSMGSCMAVIDKNRMAQIANNFLSNAMKYTSEGKITLLLEYINGGLKIAVQDTGIGIDSSKHHLIFCRFEKLDSYARGTGLGLAICKAIVDDLKGEIGFDSAFGVGSTFWAWIPCEAVVDDPEIIEPAKKKSRKGKRKNKSKNESPNLQLGLFFQEENEPQNPNILWN